jgi:preprotein translocase subunit YajC
MGPQDLVFFVFAGLAAWFLLIRPQRRRASALQEVRGSLQVGSSVMTTAGLHATVAALEGETVLLEIAPGVRARFDAGAVVRVLDAPGTKAGGTHTVEPEVPEQAAPPAD